jgi:hypothetical protein
MKKHILFLLFFVLLFSLNQNVKAQDAMILRTKPDTLKVKILEIGSDEIRYRIWPVDESMPVMVERKDRIRKIILSNGTVMKFAESEFVDASNYSNQRKANIKIDLFAVLSGTTSIAYEQSIEPGRSWEVGVGMIGLGAKNPDNENRSGAFFRAGYKFINQPDYYMKGMRYSHILKGSYIRPEICSHFYNVKSNYTDISSTYNSSSSTYTVKSTNTDKTTRYSAAAFMLNFGKQWVFSDVFLVDVFVGGGLGYGNSNVIDEKKTESTYTSSSYPYNYSDYYYQNDGSVMGTGFGIGHNKRLGFAGQMGLKLGVLIGSKQKDK